VATLAEALELLTTTMRTRLGDYLTETGEVDLGKVRSAPAGVVKRLRVTTTTDAEGQVFARHYIEAESALSAAQTLIKHYQDTGDGKREPGLLAEVLSQQPPEVIVSIARAMLAGRRRAIDVGAKVVS
jgi:hypothetical protein